ncbi:hypothetical protein [Streptomyces sp. NPDC047000]|uniref:hypothetical protein n=1 Tax=Streptomyces sp. NPDC047000 TaxID=3155474 RepID=UPI0034097ECB
MPPTPHHPADHPTATGRTHAPDGPPRSGPKIQEAADARDVLAHALTRAGIQLPAMDIRTPWADDAEGEARYALVHLGVCSAPVALMLADVILKGITT